MLGALPLVALMSSCSMGTSSPNDEELLSALQAHFNDFAIVSARRTGSCQPGQVAQRDVQVCNYCVIWVGADMNQLTGDVKSLTASRGPFQAALTRAVSFNQPLVAPSGSGGVWILATAPTRDTQSTQSTNSVALTDDQITATGVQVERDRSNFGFGPERIRTVADGRYLEPRQLLARFEPPAASKETADALIRLVGACES